MICDDCGSGRLVRVGLFEEGVLFQCRDCGYEKMVDADTYQDPIDVAMERSEFYHDERCGGGN